MTESLLDYLAQKVNVMSVQDTAEEIAATFYYQDDDYILTIPDGFGESLIQPEQKNLLLEKTIEF